MGTDLTACIDSKSSSGKQTSSIRSEFVVPATANQQVNPVVLTSSIRHLVFSNRKSK
jgi:hypothetical protein